MAHLDPRSGLHTLRAAPQRYKLKLHNISPERFVPNGDRYIVEIIDFDDMVELGQMLVAVQDPKLDPRDPMADPNVEVRGVLGGVVVACGNGHLLGLPDPAFLDESPAFDDAQELRAEAARIRRASADVPMFYKPGDIVLVDRNAKGRNLRIVGREIRVVNQIDILAHVSGVRLTRDEDGNWTQDDA